MSDNYDTLKAQANAIKARQAQRAINAGTTDAKVAAALNTFYDHGDAVGGYSEALVERMRKVLRDALATPAPAVGAASHATKENGDCPHWCRACAIEREERAAAVGTSVQPVPSKGLTVAEAMASTTMERYVDGRDQDQTTHQPVPAMLAAAPASVQPVLAIPAEPTVAQIQALALELFEQDVEDIEATLMRVFSASHTALASSTPTKGGEAS